MGSDDSAVVYWFSGTGNSWVIAKAMGGALGKDTRLIPIARALREPVPRSRTVGIVFPVHSFGLPPLVSRFLAAVPLSPDPYVFTVATAALVPGDTHHQADGILQARGISLAAGWTFRMPVSFSPVDLHLTASAQQRLLERAARRVTQVADDVKRGFRGIREDSLVPIAWMGRLVHRWAVRYMPTGDRNFRVGKHCAGCGICTSVCPVGNVRLEGGRPVWGGHCEWCFACMQWCPIDAIRMLGPAANRQRYRHPAVQSRDMAEQSLQTDEASTEEAPGNRGA